MPQQLLLLRKQIQFPERPGREPGAWDYHLSMVRFNPKEGEEIFLNYSQGTNDNFDFQHGPGIKRDGEGPPWMWCYEDPREVTTDPLEQRSGTWPHDEGKKTALIATVTGRRDKIDKQLMSKGEIELPELRYRLDTWDRYLKVTQQTPSHQKWFNEKYQEYTIIGEQGCGDLTMNSWHVAYTKSSLTSDEPKFIHLREEPLESRSYSCLVKWKEGTSVEIKDIRFHPFRSDKYRVMLDSKPIADQIEFAVYGKPIIRNGHVLDMRATCHQYSDIRHLFLLPDLNLSKQGFFYGKQQEGPIYFGEAQLLNDRNLRRAALSGPIELDRLYRGLSVSVEDVRSALTSLGYMERRQPTGLLRRGEWRFTPEDNRLVDIFLRRSQYACSMIGIDKQGGILCLAYDARAWDEVGATIKEAADILLRVSKESGYPVRDALIFDEGADVFQSVRLPGKELNYTVPLQPGRVQIRAMFIFGIKVR